MKTIGITLSDARVAAGMTLEDLENDTRIKKEFLRALESEKWEVLPEYPVVIGFVKNISTALSINREQTVALLRRDYPPKKANLSVNPKPEPKRQGFKWGPRASFAVGVMIIVLGVGGYLFRQYQIFVSPPMLQVIAPVEDQVITTKTFTVRGKTASDAVVRVNNQPTLLDSEGNFTTDIEVNEALKMVDIKAVSRSGRETSINRSIRVDLPE